MRLKGQPSQAASIIEMPERTSPRVYVLLDRRIRKQKSEDRVDVSVGITRPTPSCGRMRNAHVLRLKVDAVCLRERLRRSRAGGSELMN